MYVYVYVKDKERERESEDTFDSVENNSHRKGEEEKKITTTEYKLNLDKIFKLHSFIILSFLNVL